MYEILKIVKKELNRYENKIFWDTTVLREGSDTYYGTMIFSIPTCLLSSQKKGFQTQRTEGCHVMPLWSLEKIKFLFCSCCSF